MNRKNLYAVLIVLGVFVTGCQSDDLLMTQAPQADDSASSCIDPTPENAPECKKIEQEIIASTVYVEMQGHAYKGNYRWEITKGSRSHATVVGGRYLMTHNHFGYPLTETAAPDGDGFTGITLRKINGEKLLHAAPLTSFSIVYEDPQTLVLDFGEVNGRGFFETLGLPSVLTLNWDQVPWTEGMEVAQLDWSGEETHVDWAKVEMYQTNNEVPVVMVDNFLMKGASGGGVYWNGYHIGNNWLRGVEKEPETSQVEHTYSIVALNSTELSLVTGQ
jgi:hypothetical protein